MIAVATKFQDDFNLTVALHMSSEEREKPQVSLLWQILLKSIIKINFDTTMDQQKDRGATAVVARNSLGHIIMWTYRL